MSVLLLRAGRMLRIGESLGAGVRWPEDAAPANIEGELQASYMGCDIYLLIMRQRVLLEVGMLKRVLRGDPSCGIIAQLWARMEGKHQ